MAESRDSLQAVCEEENKHVYAPNLAIELYHQIWNLIDEDLVNPQDIYSFALTSRAAYVAGFEHLQRHQIYRARYRRLNHKRSKYDGSILAAYAKHFLLNPRAALYVKQLSIYHWKQEWDHYTPRRSLNFQSLPIHHSQYLDVDFDLLWEACENSLWLPKGEEDGRVLWHHLAFGNEDPIAGLLLTLLPNLERLRVAIPQENWYYLRGTLRWIALSKRMSRPLSRLSRVDIISHEPDAIENIEPLEIFATLPSVKTIRTWNNFDLRISADRSSLARYRDYDDYRWGPPQRLSNVESLQFNMSSIEPKLIPKVLGRFRALKSFSHVGGSVDDVPCDYCAKTLFQPSSICAGLILHASTTLESLVLRTGTFNTEPMGSLKGLQVLKELETELNLFGHHRNLANNLPRSIESLSLHVSFSTLLQFSLANIIRTLLQAKRVALQKLKKITIIAVDTYFLSQRPYCLTQTVTQFETLELECAKENIQLSFKHEDSFFRDYSCGDFRRLTSILIP